MNSYNYHANTYMNRAERRKNGIKTEKRVNSSKYSLEELEKILRRELNALINEPYSETIKKERYRRLQPLIEEYQRQKANVKPQTMTKVSHTGNPTDRMIAYNRQKQSLPTKPIYQQLTSNRMVRNSSKPNVNNVRQKTVTAYQMQTSCVQNNMPKKQPPIKPAKKAAKKGFFSRLLEWFKPKQVTQTVAPKKVISKPKPTTVQKKYYEPKKIEATLRYACNEFERAMKDMGRYAEVNPNCKIYRNNRQVNFEPRYL